MLFRQARNWNLVAVAAALLFSLLVAQVRAAETRNLYEVLVPVVDQSSVTREAAFQQAFDSVIRKLTGRSDVASMAGLSKLRVKASSYVSQFHYQERPLSSETAGQTAPGEAYYLLVRFNESAINEILRQNNLPLWGANRPSLLIWVAQDNAGKRSIVAPMDFAPVRDEVTLAASNWGVPVLYPVMDFDDSDALSISELWGLFQEPVQRASKRYDTNAVLAMRVWATGENRWSGRTLFLLNGQNYTKSYENMSATELANAAMTDVAKRMADVFAVSAGSAAGEAVTVVVDDVNSVSAYAGLMHYLESLTAVRSVVPTQVNGSRIMLRLVIDGTLRQFGHAIESGRKLRTIPAPAFVSPVVDDALAAFGGNIDNSGVPVESVGHASAISVEDRSVPASEIGVVSINPSAGNISGGEASEIKPLPVERTQLNWAADLYYSWQ